MLQCRPETSRFRRSGVIKHIDHHLIGDTSHGDGRNLAFRMRGIHRMLLHAWRLDFDHPFSDERLSPLAPPDAAFNRALALFDWRLPE